MKCICDPYTKPSDPEFEQIRRKNYSIDNDYIHTFQYVCMNGCYELAKLLWEKSNGGFNFDFVHVLRQSCYNGNLDTVKWLLTIKPYVLTDHDKQLIRNVQESTIKNKYYSEEQKEKAVKCLDWVNGFDKPIEVIII